ncbi:7526_t:CDS:2 [Diversispora eburnea]|uniref:7526_t:CDS:1 n=1 Tax=Diversispora eburnea TaxID=1213867 RepID=A0A9N9DDQ5_9GLOM|nr:7526_t:CDS:2 [Diversispora eburnea]
MISAPHTRIAISEMFFKCFNDWNVTSRILAITMDNATSNDAVINNIKHNLDDQNMLVANGSLLYQRCYAHILNLIVSDGLKIIKNIISKTQECNSVYLMLVSTIPYKSVFERLVLRDTNFEQIMPSDKDWKKAEITLNNYHNFSDVISQEDELIQDFNRFLMTNQKENTLRYPSVSLMTRDILAVPITSVASETIFSTAGRIINDYRSNLTPETVETLICD